MNKYPFEVSESELRRTLGTCIDSVVSQLQSEFLVMPKGDGFVEYPIFENAYEGLKQATTEFANLDCGTVYRTVLKTPMTLVVLRAMLGFTPSELAYVTQQKTQVAVTQGHARTLDRGIRLHPNRPLQPRGQGEARLKAVVTAACGLLTEGAPVDTDGVIHRLAKADTMEGLASVQAAARLGVPYPLLLYERVLGRPFASHRDSVSELVGASLETGIEGVLHDSGVSFRKTSRADRIVGFDQAPDFVIPNEFNPKVVIEAKFTEDDGTARDKVTRVQHLAELAERGVESDARRFEVVACIGGRGFSVRREDMKKLLLATRGKVFTLPTLHRLVDSTRASEYRSKR